MAGDTDKRHCWHVTSCRDCPGCDIDDTIMGPRSTRTALWTLAVLTLVNAVNYMDRNVLNILLPRIKDHLLLTDTQLGLVGGAAFTLFYATAALPIGWAVDRHPRRIVLATGIIVWSVATFGSGAAAGFGMLLLARAFTGSGEATAHPAGVSMIGDLFGARRRAMAIGVFQAGVAIGGGLGVILGGHLTTAYDWRCTLMIFAMTGVLLAPLIILVPEPARGAAESLDGRGTSSTTPGYFPRLRKLAATRTLVIHFATTAVVMFALQGYAVWMPSFLVRERGFTLEKVSELAGIATLVGGLVGGVLGGYLSDLLYARDRRGRLALQALASLLAIPCMLVTVHVPDIAAIVAALVGAMVLMVLMFPILTAVILDLVEPGDRGTAMSILLFVQTGIGYSLGPLAVGALSDMTKSLGVGLVAPPASLLVAVLLSIVGTYTVESDIAKKEICEKRLPA